VSLAAGLAAVAFAALAQAAVLPSFSILGVEPNLVIVLLVAWMSIRGQREALFLIPAAGFVLGLLDGEPLGLAMLALAPLVLMTEVRELRLVESDLVPALVLTVAGTLVYETTVLLSLAVRGEQVSWLASIVNVLVPAAIANVLLLLPVYAVIRLASLDLRRPRAL
jgi:rod shape-determining protein MreD